MKGLPLLLWLAAGAAVGSQAQSGTSVAVFDSQGGGLDSIIQSIKSDTNSARPASLSGAQVAEPKPIVLTIAGVSPDHLGVGVELGQLERWWHWLFPGKEPAPGQIQAEWRRAQDDVRLADFKFMGPDNYVETAVRNAAQRNDLDIEVRNIPWSRDPKQTAATVEALELELLNASLTAQGRPLYLVCHSWGSVMAHDALVRLARNGHPIPVRRFVSMGSSLVPTRFYVKAFREYHRLMDHMVGTVQKPQGVEMWVNMWADDDPFSGPIPVADHNIQVDTRVPPLLQQLKQALSAGAAKKAVKQDTALLTSAGRWHGSYMWGFQARLDVLRRDIDWDIPQDIVQAVLPAMR